MAEDIEDDVQESTEDVEPIEPSPEPEPSDTEAAVRRGIENQRERGPDGKFVKSEAKGSEPQRGAAKGVTTGIAEPARVDDGKADAGKIEVPVIHRPPPGFSVPSKQAWEALPDHVKADIAKREGEIETGLQRYGGLKQFAEEAERNGTTLQNAVADYDAVEKALRRDPVDGVEFLFQKMGLNPLGVLNAWLKRYVPAKGADGQPPPATQPQIDQNAIIAQAAERARNDVRSEFAQQQINNDIATFSSDPTNRFFANVRQDMAVLVQAGKAANLQEAYQAACWLHPEIRAILIEEMKGGQNKPAVRDAQRAQNAAKAVTGAPSSNSQAEPPRREPRSTEEALRRAIERQRGAA